MYCIGKERRCHCHSRAAVDLMENIGEGAVSGFVDEVLKTKCYHVPAQKDVESCRLCLRSA